MSLFKQIERQERAMLHARAQREYQRSIAEVPAPDRSVKDQAALVGQLMQLLTELQVQRHGEPVTADWRAATPPKVERVAAESEAASDDASFPA